MKNSHTVLPDAEILCQQLSKGVEQLIRNKKLQRPLLIGIRTGGVWVAQRVKDALDLPELGILDISFYRDDFDERGLPAHAKSSELPDSIEDRDIILIDDVLMSGRTIRAAMNEIFDYGRPTSIQLVALIDIGQRQLPIQADVVGARLELETAQKVKLSGPSPLQLSID